MLSRCIPFIACFLTFSLFYSFAYGQETFTPIEDGDYKVIKQEVHVVPNVELHGSFLATYLLLSDKLLASSDNKEDNVLLEGHLLFRTIATKNISIVADLTNKDNRVNVQPDSYVPHGDLDKNTHYEHRSGLDIRFDQLYLEYKSNPHSQVRLGRQTINPMDQQGLIYEGQALAVTHACTLGTWCYSLGAARLTPIGHNEFYWGKLSYPSFSSNKKIATVDFNPSYYSDIALLFQVYYASYAATRIPIDKNGNWTVENSENQRYQTYVQIHKTQYVGFNTKWNYHKIRTQLDAILMMGKRNYFLENSVGKTTSFQSQNVQGSALKLAVNFKARSNLEIQATVFNTTANKSKNQNTVWSAGGGYQPIQSGRYGDALLYLKGYNEQGEHHSITGLRYYSLTGKMLPYKKILVKLGIYSFSHNKGIYNEKNERHSLIGTELDSSIAWEIQDKFIANAYFAYMISGKGYSRSDLIDPVAKPKNDSLIGLNINYSF